MNRPPRTTPRALTLIELLLSLTVTSIVGMAMTAIIGAVVTGVDVRRDARSHIILAHTAQSRLADYIVPSRAILQADDDFIALWFDDSRQSGTVHGSEIRWIEFDTVAETITVYYVKFPDNWTTAQKWLIDQEHYLSQVTNWRTVRTTYQYYGLIASTTLVDHVSAMAVSTDQSAPVGSKHLALRLTFRRGDSEVVSMISGSLRKHQPPVQ